MSRGNGVVVLLFGLLLLSDLGFNRSVVDLGNQFGDNCLLVKGELKGALDGVLVSSVLVSELNVNSCVPSFDYTCNFHIF
jgi:hypothetical protein